MTDNTKKTVGRPTGLKKIKTYVTMGEEVKIRLNAYCEANLMPQSAVIELAIGKYLDFLENYHLGGQ